METPSPTRALLVTVLAAVSRASTEAIPNSPLFRGWASKGQNAHVDQGMNFSAKFKRLDFNPGCWFAEQWGNLPGVQRPRCH